MQDLKINWKFSILRPGFFLLLGLLLIGLSFIIFQKQTVTQKWVCYALISFLTLLLFYKFTNLKWFILLSVLLMAIIFHVDKKETKFILTPHATVDVYPDQVKISDDWFSAEAKAPGGRILISGKLTPNQLRNITQGYQITFSHLAGEVSQIEPASNYGQFDLSSFYHSKNITQQVKLTSCNLTVEKRGFWNYLHYLRYRLKTYLHKMPPILSFFSYELILGENPSQDFQPILNNYRDLGVIHILSISGLHVGIYTLVISTICYFFKLTENEAFCFCLLILLVGIFLCNGQAGFVRASLTYIIGKILTLNKLQINKPDLLGLTAIIHLLINPRLMLGTGALLSYILALGLELTNKMTNFKQSVALNLLLLPLLLFYFFQFNFLTVVFNLIIVPYFNWVVMPMIFLNLVVFKITPHLSWLLEGILGKGEQLIAQFSKTQIGLFTFGKINWWQCLFLLLLTSALLVAINEQTFSIKFKKYLLKGTLFFYLIVFLSIHFPLLGQVTFIDVGQGDSILISTPLFRRVFLIDVGGKLNFNGKKVTPQVNKITIPFLKAQGISKIDGIFLSHQDADHVGDLGPLLDQVKVKKLYMAQGLLDNPSFRKRIASRIGKKQVVQLLAGQNVKYPDISFAIVYPFKPGIGKNEDSLSLTFKLASKQWLFTGDLGQAGEAEIMAKYHLHADYFKLGHHGSRTASNPDFLKALQPERVFVSAGRHNRFGHPHEETIGTLQNQHISWASTQDCGMITWNYGGLMKPKFKQFLPVAKK